MLTLTMLPRNPHRKGVSCKVDTVILEQKEEQKLTSSPASGLTIGILEYSVDAKKGKSQQWRIKIKCLSRITMK